MLNLDSPVYCGDKLPARERISRLRDAHHRAERAERAALQDYAHWTERADSGEYCYRELRAAGDRLCSVRGRLLTIATVIDSTLSAADCRA